MIIEFQHSRVADPSAIDSLAKRYTNVGKQLHLSPAYRQRLREAKDLVKFNVIEDPKYYVADDKLA